ncbi:SulP family inorganic anion transporter [Acidobacteria bacterium AH-259-D05]|nr:SulP family inorganic anion transporter [Acidobacteria bacterium AH-259-D05]
MLTAPKYIPFYLLKPVRFFREYDRANLRADLIAAVTVAVILLPQALAYALIVELPPEMGIYAAVTAAIVGALWGSSHHAHTGPTNALSLLVLSSLMITTEPGTPEFIVAAGMMAVMVGVFQLAMGLLRLGVLVNFVSHSVIVGFASGAGVLIAVKQLRHLLGLDFTSYTLVETLQGVATNLLDTHQVTAGLGIAAIVIIVVVRQLNSKLPAALISMAFASVVVFALGLKENGVAIIGLLPRGIPPLADLPLLDLNLIAQLSAGALAVGAIGLVETSAISRSIATQTGQRLDSNQEFVGQGLANLVAGFFSGYPCAGSFSRSAVNFKSGARTSMSAIFSGLFVLIATFFLAPLAAYLPRAALAGVLMVTAYGMIDREEIARIFRGARGDAAILLVTFLGTLFLHIEFAVLAGILLSFGLYIMHTSVPQIFSTLPDDNFRHFVREAQTPPCPQLGVIEIQGDLYFGAVSHFEKAIHDHLSEHPGQRFLLLRMGSVNQCDFSGIHALESIVHTYRDCGGDVFMTRVQEPVRELMDSTGFTGHLGVDHFLSSDTSIDYLFHKIIDPAICIYECPVRAFKECQNLPKREYPVEIPLHTDIPAGSVADLSPRKLWEHLHSDSPPVVVDVREPREFQQGHIPTAKLVPLPQLLSTTEELPVNRSLVFVCRGGRRSTRAAYALHKKGYDKVAVLQGGMLAWEAAGLLEAIEEA